MPEEGTSCTVTFPEGRGVYLFDQGERFEGDTTTLDVPVSEYPAFVRGERSIADTLLAEHAR